MHNLEDALQLAKRTFGTEQVEQYRWDDPNIKVWTFVLNEPGLDPEARVFMVDQETGTGVFFCIDFDPQTQYLDSAFSLRSGLQSASYVLSIQEVSKWTKALKLLAAMGLDPHTLRGLELAPDEEKTWLQLGKKGLSPLLESRGELVLVDVDLNVKLRLLAAARYFKCFTFKIYSYEAGVQGDEITLSETHLADYFDDLEGDAEGFWEDVNNMI